MTTDLISSKNLYEDLNKAVILEGINGMTPELKSMIEGSPIELQRAMILTVMEENNPEHRLLCSKIRRVVEANKTGETKHIAEVVKMLREYVKVSPTEVKTMGEVMTPIELVEEMLDTLPYEVWTNPNLKWLDPCNGVGTFISVVVKRLMKGLEGFQPNAELRYKHIIENMIYIAELQAKNVFLYLYAFDPEDRYALNIFNGSYLSEEFDRHMKFWGVEKFDVIVMNPPYNESKEGKRTFQSSTLWDKFVIKTINELKEGGYLVAVHPDGWRSFGGIYNDVKNILKSKQMLYLEVHNTTDGIKTFGVSTAYDFYCLHNVPNTMFTKIKCENKIIKTEDGELKNIGGKIERVDISKMEFIPNGMYKEFEKLIAKEGEERVDMSLRRYDYDHKKDHTSKEQTEEFKYPIVYLTYKDGSINFWYSNTNQKGHFGISKVIWSNGSGTTPIIDEKGEYGMSEYCFAIIDEPKNLQFIKKAMENPDFTKLMSFSDGKTGVGMHKYNYKAIALFRKDFWKEFMY